MSKRKPCPFCGGTAVISNNENGKHFICCNNCECYLDKEFKSKEEAIEAWNTRKVR